MLEVTFRKHMGGILSGEEVDFRNVAPTLTMRRS